MERKRGRRRGKRKDAHFMDAALDGYIRDLTLDRMREIEDLMDAAELEREPAIRTAGSFLERAPYHGLWRTWWEREVLSASATDPLDALAGPIEAAVRGAMLEEQAQRAAAGAPTIEDTRHYQAFVERAMGILLEEASGEIEEL